MTPPATLTTERPASGATRPGTGPATASARRAGGPQDRALYSCACGHAFKASVSTSVGCPRCGTRQAW
jgi:hypothetical protein